MKFDKEVDARKLNCPLPILRCKKGLSDMLGNQVLKITATDLGAEKDFAAFCSQTGHELLNLDKTKNELTFYIKKRATD